MKKALSFINITFDKKPEQEKLKYTPIYKCTDKKCNKPILNFLTPRKYCKQKSTIFN